MLKDMGWETAVAARNDYENPEDCKIPYCDKYYDICFERNPFRLGNVKAYKELKKIIDSEKFDIIHCHTPVGGMLTRLAANGARKKGCKVFYTAHGFHFFRGAPIFNWLVYYPAERYLARKTDVLITIAKEDYSRARKFKAGRVEYVPGVGIDLEKFKKCRREKAIDLKESLGIPKDAVVLLSVGEVNRNKNHKIVIESLTDFPDIWYVLCGDGQLMSQHRLLAEKLGVQDRFIMTGYRTDLLDFYSMADIFVFPSLREGLPVALMEAMAMEIICVASINRGTNDLLYDSKLRFSPCNFSELQSKMRIAMTEDLSNEVINNRKRLLEFDIQNTLQMLKRMYLREI